MDFRKKKKMVAYMVEKMSINAIHYWPVHHIFCRAYFSAFPEVMFGGNGHDISGLPRPPPDCSNLGHKR